MSDNANPSPPAAGTATDPGPAPTMWNLDNFFTAVEHGAGLVYHKLLAIETSVSKWEAANPALQALFATAESFVSSVLTAHGMPVADGLSVVTAIEAALGKMAAADPTVPSGGAA